jgi:hypothetical protein
MLKTVKRAGKWFLDEVVAPLCQYVDYRIPSTTLLRELERRTAAECADYVITAMPAALQFPRRKDVWEHALGRLAPGGLAAEFGVWNGESINYLAKRLHPGVIHGFDSFEGLQEDWAGWSEPKGTFSRQGRLPKVEGNVRLVKGWFDASLPPFLAAHPGPFALVHVDCDTYESTRIVLGLIGPRIVDGTVIIFDEYLGYRGWRLGEFRAWQEFTRAAGLEYAYLSFSNKAVAVQVTRR